MKSHLSGSFRNLLPPQSCFLGIFCCFPLLGLAQVLPELNSQPQPKSISDNNGVSSNDISSNLGAAVKTDESGSKEWQQIDRSTVTSKLGEPKVESFTNVPVPDLPNAKMSDQRLQILRKRLTSALASQKAFYAKIDAGELDLKEDARGSAVSIQPELKKLQAMQEALASANMTESQRELLSRQLFQRLQPIGDWLGDAFHIPEPTELTAKQEAEFDRLDTTNRGPDQPEDEDERLSKLRVVSPSFYYGLHFLSVPLAVETDPGATIYWEAPTGGHFIENGLTLLETTADENGIARCQWISQGSAVGPADVIATSPLYRSLARFEVHVVQLIPDIGFP